FRRAVPAIKASGVRKFEDHNSLWFWATFDELGRSGSRQKAPAVLHNGVLYFDHVRFHCRSVGDLQLHTHIDSHRYLLIAASVRSRPLGTRRGRRHADADQRMAGPNITTGPTPQNGGLTRSPRRPGRALKMAA